MTTIKLQQLLKYSWTKQTEVILPAEPRALRVINRQLWCCCRGAGIVIYDNELQLKRVIPRGDMGEINDVAELDRDDIIIATLQGLYHYLDDGGNFLKVELVRLLLNETSIFCC